MLLQALHALLPVLSVLEVQVGRSLLHKRLVPLYYLPYPSVQKFNDIRYPAAVFVGTHLSGAAARAFANLEVQAGTYLSTENGVGVYLMPAGAERPDFMDGIQQRTRMHHGAVGPEIL